MGRPGRKSAEFEIKYANAKEIALKTFFTYMNCKASIEDKMRIALPVLLKGMPDKIEVKDTAKLTYEQRIQLADKLKEIIEAQNTNEPVKSYTTSTNNPNGSDRSAVECLPKNNSNETID